MGSCQTNRVRLWKIVGEVPNAGAVSGDENLAYCEFGMIDDIRALLEAESFRPFSIELPGDFTIEITNPKQVTVPIHGESIHFYSQHGETHIIAVRHMIRIRVREGRR